MARRVYFSFHYQRDLWRANVVRNNGAIEGVAAAGFQDLSLWEDATLKGEPIVKDLIDTAVDSTSVTVVLVGADTATGKYVSYEIARTLARGNGLLGIRVDGIKDQRGRADVAGAVPGALEQAGALVYSWEDGKLGSWVENAYQSAQQLRLRRKQAGQ